MLAKKVAANLRQKLDIKICEEIFLNDSRVGLSYILQNIVANWIYQIKSNSHVSQWHHIKTNENQVDYPQEDWKDKTE